MGSLNRMGRYLVTVFLIFINSELQGVEKTGTLPIDREYFLHFSSFNKEFLGILLAARKALLILSGYPLSLNLWVMSMAYLLKLSCALHRRLSLRNWPKGTPLMVFPRWAVSALKSALPLWIFCVNQWLLYHLFQLTVHLETQWRPHRGSQWISD